MNNKLTRDFFDRPTLDVAPELLGITLVHQTRTHKLAGRIVEVEAYLGPEDLASHAARKTSKRAAVMFAQPGTVYVYLVYGMYHCLNLVTEHDGTAGAVLIRSIEPLSGIEQMRANRGLTITDRNLANGPGKLCQAMQINRTHNRLDACGDTIWLEARKQPKAPVKQTPRIGVDYAGAWAKKPWRFVLTA